MMETRLDIQANGMQFHGQQQPAMYAIPFAPNPMNMQYNMQGMNVQQFMDMIIQTARQEACKEAERIVECARRRTEDLTSKVAGWIENVKGIGAQNNYMQQQLAGVVHQLKVMSEEKNKTGKDINFSIDTCRKSIEMVKQNLGQVWLEFNDQCRKIHSIMERQDVSGKIISESTDKQDKKSTKEENGDRRQRRHTDTEPMNRADSGGTERKRRNTMTNPTAGQQQVSKLKLVDKVGNILDAPDEFAVAHAVDGTLHMGAGAAADISAHLLQEDEVKMNRRVSHRVGEVITMNSKKGKKVLCVVTKPHYKMNYNKHKNKAKFMYFMTQGLRGMKRECVKHDIKKLAIPAMGSGLDQIPWHLVQQRIANIFDSMDMIIEVYHMPKGNVRGPQGSDTAAGLEDNTGNTSAQNQNTTETPIPQNNTGTSSVNAADPAATPRNRTRTTSVNSADSAMSPRRGQVQNISKPAVPPKPVGHSRTADTQPKDNRQGEVPINITGQARVDSVEIIKNHNDSSNHISQISESDVLSFRQNQEGKAPKEAITEDDNADGNKQTADSATRRGRASLGTLATVASNCPYEGANQHDKVCRPLYALLK